MRHEWINKISPLPVAALIRHAAHQMRSIVTTIDEIQEHAITGARNDDHTMDVQVKGGEILINRAKEYAEETENPGGSMSLKDLDDVSGVDPSDGDILKYNASVGKWEPVAPDEITVMTDLQYDTSSHEIQKKTRVVRVVSADDESDWSQIDGGQAVACP